VPRIRQIKPEFYLDDELARCPRDARLMFPGLWMLADRSGRLEERPARIKVQLFPYDDDITVKDVESLIDHLAENDFILRYEIDSKRYIQIRTFEKHQHCHKKEPESQLPPPPARKIPGKTGASPEKHRTSPENTGQEPGKYGADSGYLEDAALKDVTENPGASPENTGQDRCQPGKIPSSPAASGVLSIDNGFLSTWRISSSGSNNQTWEEGEGSGERESEKPQPFSRKASTPTSGLSPPRVPLTDSCASVPPPIFVDWTKAPED
jgi:hypothetical protein